MRKGQIFQKLKQKSVHETVSTYLAGNLLYGGVNDVCAQG